MLSVMEITAQNEATIKQKTVTNCQAVWKRHETDATVGFRCLVGVLRSSEQRYSS